MESAPDRLALGAFAGAILIGGSNFVAVRYSNRELDPLWGAGFRFALAAAVFAVLVAALRLPLPRGRVLALVVTYGLVGFAGAYGCLYWAMKEVPAGIAAVVLAVGPLLTLLLAVAHRMEKLNGRAVAGALIAVAGSAVIFFQRSSVDFGWQSFALLVVAALAASESVVVSKRVGPLSPVVMNFIAMTAGAAALLVVSALAGETLRVARGRQDADRPRLPRRRHGRPVPDGPGRRAAVDGLIDVVHLRPDASGRGGARRPRRRRADHGDDNLGGAIVCAGVYLGALARRGRGETS